jgi:hypothetical protein
MPARLRALAAAITVVLVAGVLAASLRATDVLGSDHPDEWDPRVLDIVEFVEAARGLEFDHPVEILFLTPNEYARVTSSSDMALEVTADLADAREAEVARLRALGLVSGPLDLGQALDQTIDASTVGFYSPDDGKIRVRGSDVTVGVRVTLAHELTHAVQDQHFDLEGLLYGPNAGPGGARAGLGLVEGDATRIEELFVQEALGPTEQAAYFEEQQADRDRSTAGNVGVPAFLQGTFAAPYVLGPTFATMLANAGGNERVDEAFDEPPTTEEHLFDPASYLAGEGSDDVDTGLDHDAVEELGTFGSTQWFLVLAERIDPFVALDAALGWDGDEYALEQRDGDLCARVVFRGDTEEDEEQMAAAIDGWLAAFPGGDAERVEVDGRPGIDACDPGPGVDLHVRDRSAEALVVPNLWGIFVAGHADAGPVAARCIARTALDGLDYERVSDPDPSVRSSLDAELRRRALEARSACGSGDR